MMFRAIRRRWHYKTHVKGRIPWCWDCCLLRQARKAGEFYDHDDPQWLIREIWDEHAKGLTRQPPLGNYATGTGQNWTFDLENGFRRLS